MRHSLAHKMQITNRQPKRVAFIKKEVWLREEILNAWIRWTCTMSSFTTAATQGRNMEIAYRPQKMQDLQNTVAMECTQTIQKNMKQ